MFITGSVLKCSDVLDVVFILDSSASIREKNKNGIDNWKLMLDFVKNIVKKLQLGSNQSRVGLVIYSDNARSVFLLRDSNDLQYLNDVIDNLEFQYEGGSRNTASGLREMHNNQFLENNGDRPEVHNVAILLTDGVSIIDAANTIPEAASAKGDDIEIYVIGISSGVDESELRDISSTPNLLGKNYWMSVDINALDEVVDGLLIESCSAKEWRSNEGEKHSNIHSSTCISNLSNPVRCSVCLLSKNILAH